MTKIGNVMGSWKNDEMVQTHVRNVLSDFTREVWRHFSPPALTKVAKRIACGDESKTFTLEEDTSELMSRFLKARRSLQ